MAQQRTDDDLQSAIKQEIQASSTYFGSEVADARRDAMERYLGEPYGNEIEGLSSVVSTDVQDTIESVMPDLMEIFASGDRICQFDPTEEGDEEAASQASDYVNYVWNVDNPGFELTHDWIKDALLQKNGFCKTWWDDSATTSEETYENVNSMALAAFLADPEVEVIEQEAVEIDAENSQLAPDGVLYDLKIKRTRKKGRVKVEICPPEEIGFSRYARSLYDADCVWHKTEKTITDLIQMGFDRDDLAGIPSGDDESLMDQERQARFSGENSMPAVGEGPDESMRKIWLYEVYIRYDFDGDGMGEWRQVFCAGSAFTILSNEVVDGHPIDTITPIRMPHKVLGRSLSDLVVDVQLIKTTIQRQLLDNMYLANNQRMLLNEDVSMDDYLANRPGGPIRVRGSTPTTTAATPLPPAPLGPHAFPMLEYFDSVRELRTGITRYNQGMDANSLNDTASGINMILGQAQKRITLMARLIAETGFRRVMLRIYKLLIVHQDAARAIRLRGKWVPMDPKSWNANFDVTIQVGIGHGTAQAKQAMLMNILSIQEKMILLQKGVDGPMVTLPKIFNVVDQLAKASGFKNGDMFFNDPSTPEMQALYEQNKQNAPPPPDVLKVQLEDKRERDKMDMENRERMARLEHDKQRADADYKYKVATAASEHDIEMARLRLEEAELRMKSAEAGQRLKIERHTALIDGQSKMIESRKKIAESNQQMLTENPEFVSTAIVDVVQQLQQSAQMLSKAAARVGGKTEFIYEGGEVVAVRHEDGTIQPVVRDAGGNMTGLGAIQ